jgi:hypothetical protein
MKMCELSEGDKIVFTYRGYDVVHGRVLKITKHYVSIGTWDDFELYSKDDIRRIDLLPGD